MSRSAWLWLWRSIGVFGLFIYTAGCFVENGYLVLCGGMMAFAFVFAITHLEFVEVRKRQEMSKKEGRAIDQSSDNTEKALSDYDKGQFEVLSLLASAYYGKEYYFLEPSGVIYSRASCKYMPLDDAISEFSNALGWEG